MGILSSPDYVIEIRLLRKNERNVAQQEIGWQKCKSTALPTQPLLPNSYNSTYLKTSLCRVVDYTHAYINSVSHEADV